MAQAANSALYSARLRFVEGLAARAQELSSTAERLSRDPKDLEAAAILRRRLHALLASSQVFEERALSLAVQDLIARLDLAQRAQRTFTSEEIDAVSVVVASLPTYIRPSLPAPAAHSDVRELLTEPDLQTMPPLPEARTAPVVLESLDPELTREVAPPTRLSRSGIFTAPPLAATPAAAPAAPRAEALNSVFGMQPLAAVPDPFDPFDLEAEPDLATTQVTVAGLGTPADAPPSHETTSAGIGSPMTAITATNAFKLAAAEPQSTEVGPHPEAAAGTALDEPTDPQLGPPVFLNQTVSGLLPMLRRPVVLIVGDDDRAVPFHDDLAPGRVEVVWAQGADEAIRALHETMPDVVLVSAALASSPEADLVRRLKSDPLNPVSKVHVLFGEGATYDDAFLEQVGADGIAREPLSDASLEALLPPVHEDSSAHLAENDVAPPGVREGTLDDIAAQIADEIRRGIAESLRVGKNERVRVGDGNELMAAAWSAVGRVRSHLAEQNRGRVRGRDDERRVSSSLLPAVSAELAGAVAAPVHPSQLLAGCRVLVADDDPAVLWFFAGLLREASAHVMQAHNGREALELARRKTPHVVVSDILMPKLDGFALCRELKRDVLLAHVPVILLSWKDDLLDRMRELDAGAAGYLRKEAGSQQILSELAEVLRPRTRLIAKLRGHAEVSGVLEEVGVTPLLELVAAERPDSRLVLRDARSVFEVDIRAGRKLSVTHTADDGTFTRGEKALLQLLALERGTFQIGYNAMPLRAALPEPLDRALSAAGRRLAALLDAVSDARLLQVSRVAPDDDVLQAMSSESSARLHEVVALFRDGDRTAETILREGRFAPGELEQALRELARSAAISGVWSAAGEDLVLAAQRDRETPQLALLSSAPPRSTSRWPGASDAREIGNRDTPAVAIDPIVLEAGTRSTMPPPLTLPEETETLAARVHADTIPGPPPAEAVAAMKAGTMRGIGGVPADAVTTAELEHLELPLAGALVRRRDRAEGLRLLATLVVLAAVGYFGWQQLRPAPAEVERPAPHVLKPAPIEPAAEQPALSNTQFGRVLPFVDPGAGVAVPDGDGLLVVEFSGSSPAPDVRVGERELGKPPLAVALPPGRHELVLRSGKNTSFRYLIVRAGETRVVSLPLADL